jgi:hypothetical protein
MSIHDVKTGDTTSAIGEFEVPPDGSSFHAACTRDDLERKLVKKLDWRMSIIIVIYTLNYVSPI